MYKPQEIIVVREIRDNPITRSILSQCPNAPVRIVDSNRPEVIREASHILAGTNGLAEAIHQGKHVLAIGSTTDVIKQFDMPDSRIGCPHFMKLVMATNGCPYNCTWCYLRLTYRDLYPCIVVRIRYEHITKKIERYVRKISVPTIFNMGELQDGLALEHLTGGAQVLIPFFGQLENGYLFILTKSDNVESILRLQHNGHTFVCWSINASEISATFEIGAPSFDRRLTAAGHVQEAGYPLRIRLDPIVPVHNWKKIYGDTIKRIFNKVTPQRITIGTLRFEETFYKNRHALVGQRPSGRQLLAEMDKLQPMLPSMQVPTGRQAKTDQPKMKSSIGKYSYPQKLRLEMFSFVISEIRKYFDGPIALCKEISNLWSDVGLDPRHCRCVCQFDEANLLNGNESVHTGTHLHRNKTLL